jgi:DNA modification methylase
MEITLINKDYSKVIKELIEKKYIFDAIITDPPYGVSRKHQLGFSNMGRSGMDYGEWDYNFDNVKWIVESSKLLRDGGNFISFCDWKNFSEIVKTLQDLNFQIKDLIRWEKSNPMPRNVNSRYLSDVEFAIWAVKGKKKWTFNKPDTEKYLKPVIKTSIVPGGKNRIHPTQKNLDLMKKIIEVHTNKGDLVFDPFSGSGTTGLACKLLQRNFVGTEINEKYYKKSEQRIGEITTKLSRK